MWAIREDCMLQKLRALLLAKQRGQRRCWAGSLDDFSAIVRARDEATFVRERIEEAVAWCEQRRVKKATWAYALGVKRNK